MTHEPDRLAARELLSRVLRGAATAVRAEWAYLLVLAVVVFVPIGLIEASLERLDAEGAGLALGVVAATLVLSALMGEVLYSGAVSALLITTPRGEQPSIGRLVRELPLWRLLVADVLVSVVVVIGFLLLIVPGLVFLAWFAFVAPVIEIEERGLRDGLRRSRELVRERFWIVLATILALTLASEAVLHATVALVHLLLGEGLLADWLAQATSDVLTNPPFAVVVVLMAVEIMRERREAPEQA